MADLEMNDLEETFNLAVNYIRNNHSKFGKDDLLKIYAYYKQATVGKCNTSRPGLFNFQEKQKWDSWNNLGEMSVQEAQSLYIARLSEAYPEWNDNKDNRKSAFGLAVSRPKQDESEEITATSIQDFVKEGNLDKVKKCLEIIEDSELNSLDDEGLGLLHWASDRGNLDVLETLLLHKNINVNLRDSDGQTALFYASSCGHANCVEILLRYNADKEILDNENVTCLDVAFDDNIKKLLS